MWLKITSAVGTVTKKHFEKMLLAGAFPAVNFQKGDKFTSYNLFEYSDTHARFMKLLDAKMKINLDPELGVFTRKHSKLFLDKLEKLVSEINETDVLNYHNRFHSFADDVRAEAMK